MKKISLSILLISMILTFPFSSFSQDDEDSDGLQELLLLKVPEETDNPNYALTFTDPSEKGIFLTIDGAEEKEIRSPYELPSLGIGDHILRFRFTDETDTERTYEDTIVIIPRPPQINTPTIEEEALLVTGTGLAGAKLHLFASGVDQSYRETIQVEDDGAWEAKIEGDFSTGVYNAVAYLTKNGYGSELSEPITFSLETTATEEHPEELTTPIYFSFSAITRDNLQSVVTENRDLLILLGSVVLFSLLIGTLLAKLLFSRSERKIENKFKAVLQKKEREPIKSLLTLGKDRSDENKEKTDDSEIKEEIDSTDDKVEDVTTVEGEGPEAVNEDEKADEVDGDQASQAPDEAAEVESNETATGEEEETSSETIDSEEKTDTENDTTESIVNTVPTDGQDVAEDLEEAVGTDQASPTTDPTTDTETPETTNENAEPSSQAEQVIAKEPEDAKEKPSLLDKLKAMNFMKKDDEKDTKESESKVADGSQPASESTENKPGDISEPDDPGGIAGLPEDLQEPADSKEKIKIPKSAGIDPYEDVDSSTEGEIPVFEKQDDQKPGVEETPSARPEVSTTSTNADTGQVTQTTKSAEDGTLSSEKFLEEFKKHDPDPEGVDNVVTDKGSATPAEFSIADAIRTTEATTSPKANSPSMAEKLGLASNEPEPPKEIITKKASKEEDDGSSAFFEQEEAESSKVEKPKRKTTKSTTKKKTTAKRTPRTKKAPASKSKKKVTSEDESGTGYVSKNRFKSEKISRTRSRSTGSSASTKTKSKRNIKISLTSKKK